VVQGPPGTGKSQTIVNLIAGALAEDKSVLFVSEKRAALEVVHRRLADAGLGDFCLELHSQKASKREILRGVGSALDRTLSAHAASEKLRGQLPLSRRKLSEYVAAVHTVHSPLGLSFYRAVGRLACVRTASALPWPGDQATVAEADLEAAVTALERLALASAPIGDPAAHAWRDSTVARLGSLFAPDREKLRAQLAEAERLGLEALSLAAAARTELGVASLATLPDARAAGQVADLLETSPGAAIEVLTSPEWDAPPPTATALITRGRRASGLRRTALGRFAPDTLSRSQADAIRTVTRYHRKVYRLLRRDYREARRTFRTMRLPTYRATLGEQAAHLGEVEEMREHLAVLEKEEPTAASIFGRHWRGSESDWDGLQGYVEWVVRFRAACVREQLEQGEAARAVSAGAPSTGGLRRLAAVADQLAARLNAIGDTLGWPSAYLGAEPLDAIRARVRAMLDSEARLGEWITWLRQRDAVTATCAGPFLARLDAGEVAADALPAVFQRAFYEAWIAARVRSTPVLASFEAPLHAADVSTFQHLDEGVLRENRDRLVALLRGRTQERVAGISHTDGWSFLQSQLGRQRGHAPVRTLLKRSLNAIRAVKPCFMMSPLMVAQCLEADPQAFDLVVFDEASQLTPQDAVGAVVRGHQLVVVGDQEQLPPTNFFDVQVSAVSTASDESGLEDLESILEQYQAAGLPSARLRWHYRSRHETLIAFSNAHIYEWDLLTFPSPDADTRERGLVFEYLPEGRYLGQGLNMVEAQQVADAVVDHARRRPDVSLGVGTFNLRQQLAIQDELERRRRDDASLEPFFALDRTEPFFVKNLENIQGDERDVILLSVTYARAEDGVLRHNFGPINGANGYRRLNVLVTRARERLVVFSSMRGDEIDPAKVQGKGAQLLRDFLVYAERGLLVSARLDAMAKAESPFEREVLAQLESRGLVVKPQVGVGPYRVDIGVLDRDLPGRFICGIECDGAAYHQSETARDRDRLRESVLRRLGWRLHRVWSTDWFKNREAQIERLIALIENSRREARATDTPIAQTRPPLAELVGQGPLRDVPTPEPPRRPSLASGTARSVPYQRARPIPSGTPDDLLRAPDRVLAAQIAEVLEVEGPLHESDLFSRVAEYWDALRVGIRIEARLRQVLAGLAASGTVVREGEFANIPGRPIHPRSRTGTRIPAERIAPSEYRAAVLAVLGTGPRSRDELLTDARRLLGFDRTGPGLKDRLSGAMEALVLEGLVGQGSAGYALRDGRPATA
jgi:very-short-patch-repair endonuclease